MSAQHTPGPWRVSRRRKNLVVIGDQGRREYSVADCVFSSSNAANARTPTAEESGANARLIAAAPELLDALREAFKAFSHDDDGPVWADSTIAKARAAIAKAEGRS